MKRFQYLAVAMCLGLLLGSASLVEAQKGKGKGGGSGGGSQSGGSGGGNSGGGNNNNNNNNGGGGGRGNGGGSQNNNGGGSQNNGGGGGGRGNGGGSGGGSQSGGSGGGSGGGIGSGGSGGSGGPDRGRGGSSGSGGGNSGGPVIISGGQDRPIQRGGRGDSLLNKKSSRSGNVNYGTVNNERRSNDRRGETIRIGDVTINPRSGPLSSQVLREERIRRHDSGWRVGYHHYDQRWCDDYFYYPHYVFNPYEYQGTFFYSPWYYYPTLPGYVNYSRCHFISYSPISFVGVHYRWQRPSNDYWGSRNFAEIDYAIEDIVRAFEDGDRRSVGTLTPRNGRVAILIGGQYAYSLNPEDFYDLMMDATSNSRTVRYEIVDIRHKRDAAYVKARHDYEDPWGRRESVFHTIYLERERNGFVIREFGTSNSRW